jgi:hypothetical protein
MNAIAATYSRKPARWGLAELLMAAGIVACLGTAIAVPALASPVKRLQTGMEDLDATIKAQAATFLLVQKISQMQ